MELLQYQFIQILFSYFSPMKLTNESFPTDLLLRTPSIPKSSRQKFSADYKPRVLTNRLKETPSTHSKTSSEVPSPHLSKSRQIIEHTFKNKEEYNQFAQKCLGILNKKNNSNQYYQSHQRQTLNSMFKNIREELKTNERKNKLNKSKQSSKQGFLVMRSQLHQQHIYNSEDKMEFYRINRASEMSAETMKKVLKDREKALRYALNPFDQVSMNCYSASLKPLPKEPKEESLPTNSRQSAQRATKRILSVSKPNPLKTMLFHLSQDSDSTYPKKLKSYLDFLFKINFSNSIYVPLSLGKSEEPSKKYKIFIGRGNNSLLIKSVIKRRFWWEITFNQFQEGIDFFWSQNKIDRVHKVQKNVGKKQGKEWKNAKKVKSLEDTYEMNKKILSQDQSIAVQKYIFPQGYSQPFENPYRPDIITNHLPNNHALGSKKNLFKSLLHYHKNITKLNPFSYLPKTYHIKSTEDPQYHRFIEQNEQDPSKIWIVKPGEHTNRGKSIQFSAFANINPLLSRVKHQNGQTMTYIVQDYLSRPLLYNNRKFDIRHYLLITSVNGQLKAYWYKEGYLRTSSYPFELTSDNIYVHLTNDAVQQKCDLFEKYQPGNKLSYTEFQRYLDFKFPRQISFEKDIIAKMKQIAIDLLNANHHVLDQNRNGNNFQLIGLDFMIDRQFRPWLIQANYNPCLEVNCNVQERIIPALIQNTFRLGLDPLFPPNSHFSPSQRYNLVDNYLKHCKYELIFDQPVQKQVNEYPFEEESTEDLVEYPDQGREIPLSPTLQLNASSELPN